MQHFNKMVDGSIFDISGCVDAMIVSDVAQTLIIYIYIVIFEHKNVPPDFNFQYLPLQCYTWYIYWYTSVSSRGSIASGFGTISHCVVLIILYNYTLTLQSRWWFFSHLFKIHSTTDSIFYNIHFHLTEDLILFEISSEIVRSIYQYMVQCYIKIF